MTVKATARIETNIKPMTGGGPIAVLPVGGYVFGDEGSTDITGFTRWYTPTGKMELLGVPCKAWKANLTITNEVEPPITEPPVSETFAPPAEIMARWEKADGTYTDYFTYRFVS